MEKKFLQVRQIENEIQKWFDKHDMGIKISISGKPKKQLSKKIIEDLLFELHKYLGKES